MVVKFELALNMTRRQKAATSIWCGAGTSLFLVPSAVAGFADVSAETAAAGLGVPAAVAVVFWLAKSLMDQHDGRRAYEGGREAEEAFDRREAARLAAEADIARRRQPVRRPRNHVIDGEVISR